MIEAQEKWMMPSHTILHHSACHSELITGND